MISVRSMAVLPAVPAHRIASLPGPALTRPSIPAMDRGCWKHGHEAYAATGELCVMLLGAVVFWGF
jgi:hypothetical protein